MINPHTFEEESLLEKVYIDEVRYRFNNRNEITTPQTLSIPKSMSIQKEDRLIKYVLLNDCYMIQSIRLLSPLDLE